MNISICAVIRKDKINKAGTAPIHIRFTENRKIRYLATGISLPMEYWNGSRQAVENTFPNATELQFKIDETLRTYQKRLQRLEILDMNVSLETLIEAPTNTQHHTIEGYFNKQIEQMKVTQQYATASKYNYTLVSFQKFGKTNITFDSITPIYLQNFELYLRKQSVKENSIATKFSVLKAVYNKAIADGLFIQKDQ